jgi:hypothetical protein
VRGTVLGLSRKGSRKKKEGKIRGKSEIGKFFIGGGQFVLIAAQDSLQTEEAMMTKANSNLPRV